MVLANSSRRARRRLRDVVLDNAVGAGREDRGVDLAGAMALTRTPRRPKIRGDSRVSAASAAFEVA